MNFIMSSTYWLARAIQLVVISLFTFLSVIVYVVDLVMILVWRFSFNCQIQSTPTLIIVMCIMSISQAIYTQHYPICRTKCPPIYIAFQFTKFNICQMYDVYGY